MASWADVEFLITVWYQEATHDAGYDLVEVESELDDLLRIVLTGNAERSIMTWATSELNGQWGDIVEGVRPELRLSTTDRRPRYP